MFSDLDQNHLRDDGEAALPDTTVYLDSNGNGRQEPDEPHTLTDETGRYLFRGLLPGTYHVRQDVPSGYVASAPVGAHEVRVLSGQEMSGNDFANRDIVAPSSRVHALPAQSSEASFLVEWSSAADASGVAAYDIVVSVDGGSPTIWLSGTTATSAIFEGALGHRYAFWSIATDRAGNREEAPTAPDARTTIQAATAVQLSTPDQPSVFGQNITLMAVVTAPADAPTPAGEVIFTLGSRVLGRAPLEADGRARFVVAGLTVGEHTLSATFVGSELFLGSSADLTHSVLRAGTSTSLRSSHTSLTEGQLLTLTVDVDVLRPGSGAPTGNVLFRAGERVLGRVPLTSLGQAMFTTTELGIGHHTLTASYEGDTNFLGSFSNSVEVTGEEAVAEDVSSRVRVLRGGFRFDRRTGRYLQTLTLTNISSAIINGPISLAIDNLPAGVRLWNATGTTQRAGRSGSPYITLTENLIAVGQSVSLVLEFLTPNQTAINYATRILAGRGRR